MKKRIIFLFMTLIPSLSSFAYELYDKILWQESVESDGIVYEISRILRNDDIVFEATVLGLADEVEGNGELTLRSTVTDEYGTVYIVTGIERYAFSYEGFSSIIIPEGITDIGEGAFSHSDSLISVSIPPTVKNIGKKCFEFCYSLSYAPIPDGVTIIDDKAFQECHSLTSISIPKSVTSIGSGAFDYCTNLSSIRVDPDNYYYDSRQDCNAINISEEGIMILGCKNSFIPDGIRIIRGAFNNCEDLASITIPQSVIAIEDYSFRFCHNIKEIILPEHLQTIGDFAFYCCNIKTLSIPESVKSIGGGAFEYCNLSSLNIPSSVEHIGPAAFQGNPGLKSITVDPKNRYYDSRNGCNAIIEKESNTLIAATPSTIIPNGITVIGEGAFCGFEDITSFVIPNGIKQIGKEAFMGSGLTSIIIPQSVTVIGNDAFSYTNLSSVELSSSIQTIGNNAFAGTQLLSITIPEGVKEIGSHAFSDCYNLVSITIPSTVERLGYHFYERNFYAYDNSIDVHIKIRQTNFDRIYSIINNIDDDYNSHVTLYVPVISFNHYMDYVNNYSLSCPFNDIRIGIWGRNVDGIYYQISSNNNKTATVVYGDYEGAVNIPENVVIDGIEYQVTGIDDAAFYNCNNITSITIPQSVTTIGKDAFYGTAWYNNQSDGIIYAGDIACGYKGEITSINLREGTKGIADNAFGNCIKLTSIRIPSSVTSIGQNAFSRDLQLDTLFWDSSLSLRFITQNYQVQNTLKCVVLGENMTMIEDEAFYECSCLDSIAFPKSLAYIGYHALYGTPWYEKWYYSQSSDFVYIGNVLFKYKGSMEDNTSIVIPDGVTGISYDAFRDSRKLTSISIPNSVKYIGGHSFQGCSNLVSLSFPEGARLIEGTSTYSYPYEQGISFANCAKLESISIPEGVTEIGEGAFYGCTALHKISIPSSVSSIFFVEPDPYGYYGSERRYNPFADCRNIDTIHWNTNTSPQSLTWYCHGNLKYVEIGDSVTDICENAFSNAFKLTSIHIPANVSHIGNGAFSGCYELKSITVDTDNKYYDSRNDCNAIIEKTSNTLLLGCKNTVIPDEIKAIGPLAFYYCNDITSITIPEGVTRIDSCAFMGCGQLSSIIIPSSVLSIGDQAFGYCVGLTSLNIPSNVSSIGQRAFYGCSQLTSITVDSGNMKYDSRNDCNAIIEKATSTLLTGSNNTVIPDGITHIGDGAFFSCKQLSSITIPNSVISIGDEAFRFTGLSSISMSSNLTSIGEMAFSGCYYLESFIIPESVTYIGAAAFEECHLLTSINIPKRVTAIYGYTFGGCSSLDTIVIPSNVTYIGDRAFANCDSLKSISFPSTITYIGHYVLERDWNLESVYFQSKDPESLSFSIETLTDYSGLRRTILYVPGGKLETYIRLLSNGYGYNYIKGGMLADIMISDSIESGIAIDGISYEITSYYHKTAKVVYGKYEGELIIPQTVMIDGVEYRVTGIDNEAFYDRKRLTDVYIPECVTTIGKDAFHGCDCIASLTVSSSTPYNLEIDNLGVNDSLCILYVPGGSRYMYRQTAPWSNIKDIRIAHQIACGTERDGICYEITSSQDKTVSVVHKYYKGYVNIPLGVVIDGILYNVTGISTEAFSDCDQLTSIRIPETIESLEQRTFENCTSLTNIIFAGSPNIGENVFIDCPNIESVTSAGLIPGKMEFCNPFMGGEYENLSADDNTSLKHVYSSIVDREVSEIKDKFGRPRWEFQIIKDSLPAGKYNIYTGILPNDRNKPNYFSTYIYGITDNGQVLLYEPIIEIDYPPFVVVETFTSDAEKYDSVLIASALEIPSGYKGIKIVVRSQVNDNNISRYSATMLFDRIFFEPLDNIVPESYCGPFTESVFNNATLYVQEEAVDTYRNTPGWSLFKNIAIDTSVDPISMGTAMGTGNSTIHDVIGRKVMTQDFDELQPGLYIIDGKKYLKR